MSRLPTPEASDPFFRVRSELRKIDPATRLRYSNQFARDAHSRLADGRESTPSPTIHTTQPHLPLNHYPLLITQPYILKKHLNHSNMISTTQPPPKPNHLFY